jgi:hypothetical protein
MFRSDSRLPWLAVLLVALALRLPALTAALPYLNYVDEGHVLHKTVHLLATGQWDPEYYTYPSLPSYSVTAAALLYSPVYAAVHDRPLRSDLSEDPPRYYDILGPPELIVLGRLINLALALGIVVLTGRLTARLAGPAAGLCAAWLAALIPALVIRGAIVTVDPYATFFTLAALLFAERCRAAGTGDRPRLHAGLAGVMIGLAAVSKYPAGLVCLPVTLAVVLSEGTWMERLRRLVLAGVAAMAAAAAGMPALVIKTGTVIEAIRAQSGVYSRDKIGSYWEQAVHRAEWDRPLEHPEVGIVFLALAAAGLAVSLRDRRWSKPVWGWVLLGTALGLTLAPYSFRAFRNFLALVPLACSLVALLYAWVRETLPTQRWRRGLDLAAALFPVLLFLPPDLEFVRHQLTVEDSREEAIAWLGENTGPEDRLLVSQELAFLPERLASLEAETDVRAWGRVRDRVLNRRVRWVVLGDLRRPNGDPVIPVELRGWILLNYQIAARFGSDATHPLAGAFRGNRQTIYVLKRVPRPEGVGRPPRKRS